MKTNFATNFLKVALLLSLSMSLSNCSKSDDPEPSPTANPEVNPLTAYLATTGFDQTTTNHINSGDYEFGLSFKPTVNGKITALVVKIPDAHLATRITIWDKATSTVLRSEAIDITTAGVEVTKAITPLTLTANTEYMVTCNSNDWYDHRKTDGSSATYPVTSGDLIITGYSYRSGTAQTIPNSPQTNYYAGDLSFKFQKS